MATEKNYLSEFEQEWNSEFETADDNEFEFAGNSGEDEFESENDDEFETGSIEPENDFNAEFEADDELDNESDDETDEEMNADGNSEFEDRLYSILSANHETELEFDQQMNEVLHEMEQDYFWGALKNKWKKFKKSGLFSSLKKLADKTPIGGMIKQATAVARGDIKGFLKKMATTAISAGQALPYPGASALAGMAKNALNLETPAPVNHRQTAKAINTVAKRAYATMGNQLSNMSANQRNRINSLGKISLNKAWQHAGNRMRGRKHYVTIHKDQVLIVRVK